MRSAEQRLPAFIFPSSPEKGRSLFLGYLLGMSGQEIVLESLQSRPGPRFFSGVGTTVFDFLFFTYPRTL